MLNLTTADAQRLEQRIRWQAKAAQRNSLQVDPPEVLPDITVDDYADAGRFRREFGGGIPTLAELQAWQPIAAVRASQSQRCPGCTTFAAVHPCFPNCGAA
jgi:hypothetical protein